MFDDSQPTRRELLGGAVTAASVGLAGCSSVLGGSSSATPTQPSDGAGGAAEPTTGGGTTASTDTASGDAAHFRATTGTVHGVDLTHAPVVGAADADVSIYYWSDYQCPFCKQFETETYPKLLENEVADGTARLVLLQFPNIGRASASAALLAKGVWHQVKEERPDRFGAWHSHVFENQEKPNSGWAEYSKLLDLTREVDGVDTAAVDEYVRNNQGTLSDVVKAEQRAGKDAGISGTPGFMLYGSSDSTKLMGAQPYPRFQSAIENLSG
jgi:protein-disulfide isomerase